MFSAFPSDLDPRHFHAAPSGSSNQPPVQQHAPLDRGSVAAYRGRLAGGALHHTGQTLRYPGALPTSGVNPVIVELRRAPPSSAPPAFRPPLPVQVPPSQPVSPLLPVIAPPPPSSSPAAATSANRELIVPTLSPWDGPAFNKPVVDRVAFNFLQPPIDDTNADVQPREVALKSMTA